MELLPTDFDLDAAKRITNDIRSHIKVAWERIAEAYAGRVWISLGYDNWDDYINSEFGAAPLRVPRQERQEIVGSLREAGLSTRAIAAATGESQSTVQRDVGQLNQNDSVEAAARLRGLDGKDRPASRPAPEPQDEIVDAEIVSDEHAPQPPSSSPPRSLRRRPITDQVRDAGMDLRKTMEKIEKLLEDDRVSANRKQVTFALRGHLLYVADAVAAALNAIPNIEKDIA